MDDRLPLPSPEGWDGLGIADPVELHVGKQSRVFAAWIKGQRVAVKLTDGRMADHQVLAARMALVVDAAASLPSIVAPLALNDQFVSHVGERLVTATPLIDGTALDGAIASDAHAMGTALAGLHHVLASFDRRSIPGAAGLGTAVEPAADWQLLHGDFSDQNMLRTADGLRILDFDDCGYGPIEYDLANSLYMVLFDSDVNERPDRYVAFRPAFLAGYTSGAQSTIDESVLDEFIGIRIASLGRWLDDLNAAPIGIRTSTPEWLATLRDFVERHQQHP